MISRRPPHLGRQKRSDLKALARSCGPYLDMLDGVKGGITTRDVADALNSIGADAIGSDRTLNKILTLHKESRNVRAP